MKTTTNEVQIGENYTFNYPSAFVTLPDYTSHAGQTVKILRQLTLEEVEQGDSKMYEVQAEDGWIGHACEDELIEIEEECSDCFDTGINQWTTHACSCGA